MTEEKIIEKIEEYSLKHYSCDPTIKYEWWELSNTDKTGLADELLSMLEQEKKEVAREIFRDIRGCEHHSVLRQEEHSEWWESVWTASELIPIAKEYGVEL